MSVDSASEETMCGAEIVYGASCAALRSCLVRVKRCSDS